MTNRTFYQCVRVGSIDEQAFASGLSTGEPVMLADCKGKVVQLTYFDSPLEDDEMITGIPKAWALGKLVSI